MTDSENTDDSYQDELADDPGMKSQPEDPEANEKTNDDASDSDDETEAETNSKNDTVPGLVNTYCEGTGDLDSDKKK